MKYQIYLNKQTSEFINKLAIVSDKKPNSVIKELIESMVTLSLPLEQKILEEESNAKRNTKRNTMEHEK